MKLTAYRIGVDAGMIIVCDVDYLKTVKHNLKQFKSLGMGERFKIPNGHYRVHYDIPQTWNGAVDGDEELTVTGGAIIVVDPCYIIGKSKHKDWMEWLKDTDYGRNLKSDKAFIISSMGGDGEYEVSLTLVPNTVSEEEFVKDITK